MCSLKHSTGHPLPEIKWYKDDQKLKSKKDKRITMDFDAKQSLYILTIKDALVSDEGAYKLKVSNEQGSVSVRVMVTARQTTKVLITENGSQETIEAVDLVLVEEDESKPKAEEPKKPSEPEPCKPKIEVAPQPVEFQEGETISLSCKVSGQDECPEKLIGCAFVTPHHQLRHKSQI